MNNPVPESCDVFKLLDALNYRCLVFFFKLGKGHYFFHNAHQLTGTKPILDDMSHF